MHNTMLTSGAEFWGALHCALQLGGAPTATSSLGANADQTAAAIAATIAASIPSRKPTIHLFVTGRTSSKDAIPSR